MPRLSVGLSGDGLLLVGLEPGELDLQVVGAGEEAGEEYWPRSSLTAFCTAFVPVLVSGDGRARQDAAARVLNGAADGSCC